VSFYGFLADGIVFIHLLYMGYVVVGQLAILIGWPLKWSWIRNPWFRGTHLAMILVVGFEAAINFECPLTTWEHQLRELAGQKVNRFHVEGISFTGQMLRDIQFVGDHFEDYVNPIFITAALIVLLTAFLVPPRFRRQVQPAAAPAKEKEPQMNTD
jgi:hypothetical protein